MALAFSLRKKEGANHLYLLANKHILFCSRGPQNATSLKKLGAFRKKTNLHFQCGLDLRSGNNNNLGIPIHPDDKVDIVAIRLDVCKSLLAPCIAAFDINGESHSSEESTEAGGYNGLAIAMIGYPLSNAQNGTFLLCRFPTPPLRRGEQTILERFRIDQRY